MQTKTLFFFYIFLGFCVSIFSQNFASSIDLGGGYIEDGYAIVGTYNYHLNKETNVQFSVLASFAKDKESDYKIPYNTFVFQGGMLLNLWEESNFKKHKITVGGGGVLGYEIFNNELESGVIINGESKLIYGLFATIEYEFYLSNEFALIGKASEYYHVNSSLGNYILYAGLSIRYYLF